MGGSYVPPLIPDDVTVEVAGAMVCCLAWGGTVDSPGLGGFWGRFHAKGERRGRISLLHDMACRAKAITESRLLLWDDWSSGVLRINGDDSQVAVEIGNVEGQKMVQPMDPHRGNQSGIVNLNAGQIGHQALP